MAEIKRKKYAIVDVTNVAAVRTGQVPSSFELEEKAQEEGVQNGMLLAYDPIEKLIKLPTDKGEEVYLHWSEEEKYERGLPRNEFKEFKYPRVLKLHVDDLFETNAVNGNVTKGHYAVTDASKGFIQMVGAKTPEDAAVILQVVDTVVLNNGEDGAKFVVVEEA